MEVDFLTDSELMRDYLCGLFRYSGRGPVRVDASTDIGRLLVAYVRQCPGRPERPVGDTVITLELGMSEATQALKDKWLYYPAGDMKRLNLALRASFDIDLFSFYLKAESLGFGKKDIVEAFIESRGLASVDPFDAVHKRLYRRDLEKQKNATRILQRKIYYLLENVNMGGLYDKTGRKGCGQGH